MTSALARSVAAMDSAIGHPMDQECAVCLGGWWHEDGGVVGGVHVSERPYARMNRTAMPPVPARRAA